MMLRFFLLALFFVPALSLAENECGGLNALSSKIGVLCDSSMMSPCKFGLTACHGKDAVMCNPDCAITSQRILEMLKTVPVAQENTCLNGGRRESATSRCICPHLYSGERCETRDVCADVECGLNGYCVNGICVCDTLFTGNKCEIKSDCRPPNFVWTGTACKCQPGFEGDGCDKCIAGMICVPADPDGIRYSPMIFTSPEDVNELLLFPLPPPYTVRPFLPSPDQACSCVRKLQSSSSSKILEGDNIHPVSVSVSAFFDEFDGDGWFQPSQGDYLHRHFKHHYSRSDNCYGLEFTMTVVFVFMVIVLLIWLVSRGCTTERKRDYVPLPSRTPVPRSPPVSHQQHHPHHHRSSSTKLEMRAEGY
jgi:hypothetical protein